MYVAFLLSDLKGGGAQKMVLNLANWFAQQGHQCDLIVLSAEGIYEELIAPEVTIYKFEKSRAFQALPLLIHYCKKKQPDVLFSALYYVNIIAIMAKTLAVGCETKLVLSERNHLTRSLQSLPIVQRLFWRSIIRWFYPLSDHIVGISDGVCDDLKRYLAKKIHPKLQTIYNPVISEDFEEVLQKNIGPIFPEDCTLKLISSGRLVPQKDHKTLFHAFAIYLKKDAKAHLVVLGVGQLEGELKSLCRRLQISENVTFLGFVNHPLTYLKQADVFIVTSIWEGFCNVIVEALFCGLSIVSTDCPSGPAEILEDGKYGFLCNVGDVDGLSEAIFLAAQKPFNASDQKQRSLNFQVDKIAKQFQSTFLSLIK